MLPKGMLFDLDDTIIAFDAVAQPVWESVCRRYSHRVGGCDPTSLFGAISAARKWYWSDAQRHRERRQNLVQARREIVGLALKSLGLGDPAMANEIADAYSIERDAAVHLFPGAEETLRYLVAHGVLLALVTNGGAKPQRQKVERFGLSRYFATILIEGELGYGKPDLAIYHRALDDLRLAPSDVWTVGDNLDWDVAVPQRLGMYAIWNDYSGRGLPPDSPVVPDRVVRSISELMEPV